MSIRENKFQAELKKDIKKRYPGSLVFKTDIQGMPDLIILKDDKWVALECKKDDKASRRPNQSYYVDKMNDMSYASFIFPENKEDVLFALDEFFGK